MPRKVVYFGLGSNIGDRLSNLQRAVAMLNEGGLTVQRVSSIWETEPAGFADQGWFLNIVVEASTELMPLQLLTRTASIEQALGRKRVVLNGPRTIDIDILLYGRKIIETPALIVPHPRMAERRFVLNPLAELAPKLIHPTLAKTIASLLKLAPDSKLKLASKWKEPAVAGSLVRRN